LYEKAARTAALRGDMRGNGGEHLQAVFLPELTTLRLKKRGEGIDKRRFITITPKSLYHKSC
jgi:hypothetical protein